MADSPLGLSTRSYKHCYQINGCSTTTVQVPGPKPKTESDEVCKLIDFISIIFPKQKALKFKLIIPKSMPKVVVALSRSNELIQKLIYFIVYCFANKYLFLSIFRG